MNYVYSQKADSFYAVSEKDAYVASGTWPDDGVEVEDEEFHTFISAPPEGKVRSAGKDGKPVWADAPPKSNDELYEAELSVINSGYEEDKKKLRDAYLNAIVFDGPSEDDKRTAIYNELQERNRKYASDVNTLNDKYGGKK